MNKYFCKVALDLNNKIKRPTNKNLRLPERKPKTIFCEQTDIYEISKTIHELKNKAGGVDKIHTKVLKSLAVFISSPLEHIINLSVKKQYGQKNSK